VPQPRSSSPLVFSTRSRHEPAQIRHRHMDSNHGPCRHADRMLKLQLEHPIRRAADAERGVCASVGSRLPPASAMAATSRAVDYLNKVFNTFFVLFALSAPALCPAIRHGQAATKIRRRHRQRSHARHLYKRHQRERVMAGLRHEICPTADPPRNPRGEERLRSSVQRMSGEQFPLTDRTHHCARQS
jgi:hypothetical protein